MGCARSLDGFSVCSVISVRIRFQRFFWYVFAISASVVTFFLALALVTSFIDLMYDKYYRPHHCDDPNCNQIEFVSHNVYYHNHHDGKGYLFNARTGEKLLRHVAWIAKPDKKDSLVCYSDGEKRGYFNRYTGKVAIAPKYNHAWIFSGGIASVEEDGYIKFINGRGEVVIDPGIIYYPQMEGYIFEGDYCVVGSIAEDCYGLMDRTGENGSATGILHDYHDFWRILGYHQRRGECCSRQASEACLAIDEGLCLCRRGND